MTRRSGLQKAALGIGATLTVTALLIQVKQPSRTNPPVESEIQAPPEIAEILERSCYPCHSNETQWPWYAYVAPVSWWVVEHVQHGRGDLNFSDWPTFDMESQAYSFRDIDQQIARGEMPLPSYLLMHREAQLSDADKAALRAWAQSHF